MSGFLVSQNFEIQSQGQSLINLLEMDFTVPKSVDMSATSQGSYDIDNCYSLWSLRLPFEAIHCADYTNND